MIIRNAVSIPGGAAVAQQVDAVAVAELDVAQREVDVAAREPGRGLGGAARLVHRVAGAGEGGGEDLAQRRFVVDDEYLHGFSLIFPFKRAGGTVTSAPFPGCDSSVMSPPASRSRRRLRARPIPQPLPWGLVVKNSSKARPRVRSSMPRAVVRHGEHDRGALALRGDADAAGDARLGDRVAGVGEQVHEDLGEVVADRVHRGQAPVDVNSTLTLRRRRS